MTHLSRLGYRWLAIACLIFVAACGMESGTREPVPQPRTGTVLPQGAAASGQRTAVAPANYTNAVQIPVALVVPLSGDSEKMGQAMQDAAAMALFDKYANVSRLGAFRQMVLVPEDSGDTPDATQKAMAEVLAKKPVAVLGPLFSDTVVAATPAARKANVPLLAFSNNREVAGQGVYVLGYSPEEQAARIVEFAVRNQKPRIAILTPADSYGDKATEAAKNSLSALALEPALVARYGEGGDNLQAAVAKLSTVEFDALFLPEGGEELAHVLKTLEVKGITPAMVQFLGTGLWDDPELLRSTNLDGAWIASGDPRGQTQFETRFQHLYGYKPPRLASLAYDAAIMVATLVTQERALDASTLTQSAGYNGPANGSVRLYTNGTSARSLAVLRVASGKLQMLEAPSIALK